MSCNLTTLSQLALDAAANGLWTIKPGRALTLHPHADGDLRIARGAVWATARGPHAGNAGGPGGDLLLEPGEHLALLAGESLVLEPIATTTQTLQTVAFDWSPAPARRRGLSRWLRERGVSATPAHCA